MSEEQTEQQNEQSAGQQFDISRVYVKDISTEVPHSPKIFQQDWDPKIDLNLGNSAQELDEDGVYEVSLTLTVTASLGEEVAYVIEVEQAGIFILKGFEEEQRGYLIGAMIPNILFPYARETISSLSQKAGFPPMLLNPIDFNGLYQQHIDSQNDEAGEETQH